MSKVLIFGVNGFVGYYLTQEFLKYGYDVFGSDKKCSSHIRNEKKFIKADLIDYQSIYKIIHDVVPDIIINLAAISSVGASWLIPQKTIMINVIGALNILEASKGLKVSPKVMFIGSSEEYAVSDKPICEQMELDACNPYGISKITQEKFADLYKKEYGIKIYYVRPFNHTGIGQEDTFALPGFCKQVAEIEKSGRDGVIKVGNLSIQRDFSHVKDIVRAYRMIIESDKYNKIYNVGYGKAFKLSDILDYIINLSSQKINIETDYKRFRPLEQQIVCCDRSLISSELNWKPEFSVFDALKEMYNYYLNGQAG